MSRATSSTRSVMITRSLCPRLSWTCCASCTLMVLSSPKIEPLGREHSNVTSWSEDTFRSNSQRTPRKLSFWDLCRANGEFHSSSRHHKGKLEMLGADGAQRQKFDHYAPRLIVQSL